MRNFLIIFYGLIFMFLIYLNVFLFQKLEQQEDVIYNLKKELITQRKELEGIEENILGGNWLKSYKDID